MMAHRSKPSSKPSSPPTSWGASSLLYRIGKFVLSIYVLCALFYTFYHFVVAPAASVVRSGSGSGTGVVLSTDSDGGLSVLLGVGTGGGGDDFTEEQKELVMMEEGKVPIQAQTEILNGATKTPSLEQAAVRAAEIKEEEDKDRIWGAAIAIDSRGKKKAAAEREKYMVYRPPAVLEDGLELVRQRMEGPKGVEWDRDVMHWHHMGHELAHSGERKAEAKSRIMGVKGINNSPLVTTEDHFLSLSFSSALQPSKVIPYYYRATGMDEVDFEKEDITITTLITSNRFKVFERLVERYQGEFVESLFSGVLWVFVLC